MFSFSLLSFNYSIYSSSTISKRDAIVADICNPRTHRDSWASIFALFTSKSKEKKIPPSLSNQHSVILPTNLLNIKQIEKDRIAIVRKLRSQRKASARNEGWRVSPSSQKRANAWNVSFLIDHFQKYHDTLCLSLQNFAETLFPFSPGTYYMVPRENISNTYAKFRRDKQRVLLYFWKWPLYSGR